MLLYAQEHAKRKCRSVHGLRKKDPFIPSIQRAANRNQSSRGREVRFTSAGKIERRKLGVKWCERGRQESCCRLMSSCCWQGRSVTAAETQFRAVPLPLCHQLSLSEPEASKEAQVPSSPVHTLQDQFWFLLVGFCFLFLISFQVSSVHVPLLTCVTFASLAMFTCAESTFSPCSQFVPFAFYFPPLGRSVC